VSSSYRIPVASLGLHLGLSERTIRRWLADPEACTILDLRDDDTVDDLAATAYRDLQHRRRHANLRLA
jgi:MoxR-like ATPase